jgi:hypothetical protein
MDQNTSVGYAQPGNVSIISESLNFHEELDGVQDIGQTRS